MTEELKEKLKTLADHYGYSVQAMKLAEEGAEYGAVLFKSAVFSWMKSEGHPDGYIMKNMEEHGRNNREDFRRARGRFGCCRSALLSA